MLTPKKQEFVNAMSKEYGEGAVVSRFEINEFASKNGFNNPSWLKKPQYKCGHGKYQLPTEESEVTQVVSKPIQPVQTPEQTSVNLIANAFEVQNLVPSKFEGFVPWGHYNTIKQISKSGMFYPVFVTGLSGNGKTLMIEQIHAELKKELIRVNITIETDEDDLLGGFRLVNGETKFVPGPVIDAMERGCTLLLDECDLGSNKLMCLQPVLEGKGVYLKKVNKWVTPKQGFNVMATANTKGKGSEDGRFIGTNVLNEAFLERFPVTFEQAYPSVKTEFKILQGLAATLNIKDDEFCQRLVDWGDIIRKTFYDGGIEEIISTRRLVHIIRAYAIFKNKAKAIEVCVNRFDDETKQAFMELYDKVDADVEFTPVDDTPQS